MIWSPTIHPTRPNVKYAGSAPIALYRSLDSGDTWHRLRNAVSPAHCERAGFDSRVLRITVDPNRPDDVYAALEVSGVIRSSDGGETWSDMSAPLIKFVEQPRYQSNVGGRHCGLCEGMLDSHATAISPAAPETVFLGIRMGLFRSDDRGTTWHDTENRPLLAADLLPRRRSFRHTTPTCVHLPVAGGIQHRRFAAPQWGPWGDVAAHRPWGEGGFDPDGGRRAFRPIPLGFAALPGAAKCSGPRITAEMRGSEYRLPDGVEDVYAVACA